MNENFDASSTPGTIDDATPAASMDGAALQRRWVLEIERYERKAEKFGKQGKRIIERFTAAKKDENAATTTFNLLWSNVQTLQPALYSKDPTPEVERRFKDKDPIGRAASEVLERCCTNLLATQKFGDVVRQAVLDRLLPGRGVMWARYLPHFRPAPGQSMAGSATDGSEAATGGLGDGAELTTDEALDEEEVYAEEVVWDFVPWTDFGHVVARTWEEVPAVWRISYLDRQEAQRRFKEKAAQLPFDQKPDGLDKESDGAQGLDKTKIYEIWDKRTKRVIRLHKSVLEVLEVQDDPLQLDDFWPCPKPLQATVSSASFIPTADYILWQDQAKELDRLSQRITMLTRALKVVGVYDSSVQALGQLLSGGTENTLVPVDAWAAFAEKGGMKGAVELLDVSQIGDILTGLYDARDKVKADIYEISGLSDLLRGASDPSETATAQEIKANYASVRLKDMQRQVQVFARDGIKIAAEIVCGQFSLDTIRELSGVNLLTDAEKMAARMQQAAGQQFAQRAQQAQAQAQQSGVPFNPAMFGQQPPPVDPQTLKLLSEPSWEEVEGLLRDRPARNFRIDIETDSTIAQDERAEQSQRLEFATVVGKLIESAEQVFETVPELAPAVAETFMFVLRSFKVGRPTESAFQEAMDKLVARAAQPQPPKPNPDVIKVQGQLQIDGQKAQADAQNAQRDQAFKQQLEQQKFDHDKQIEAYKAQQAAWLADRQQQAQERQAAAQNAIEERTAAMQAQNEAALERMRAAFDAQAKQADATLQLLLKRLDSITKIEVAEITAGAALDAAEIGAANAGAAKD